VKRKYTYQYFDKFDTLKKVLDNMIMKNSKKYIYLFLFAVILSSCQTNTQDYPSITTSPKSKSFEIVQLVSSRIKSQISYDTIHNNLLFLAGDDREVFLYKVNNLGNVKDSIHFSYGFESWDINIKGTTIFKDSTYIDWITSKSKEIKNFKSIYNRSQNAEQNTWNKLFKNNYDVATEVYFKSGYERDSFLMHCYFKIDNDWHLMYPNKDDRRLAMSDHDVETDGFAEFAPKNKRLLNFESLNYTNHNDIDWEKGNDTIRITKFIKKETERVSGQLLWHGIAFYNFKYKNENLNFKLNTDRTFSGSDYNGYLNFYYPKTLPFALIEVSEEYYGGSNGNADSKEIHRNGIGLYMIRKR
jgi:hypothetical protein